MSEISFDSRGTRCAGIHLAGDTDGFLDEDGLRPCVVLAHGFGGTADSGLVPYAERFAAAGLHALAVLVEREQELPLQQGQLDLAAVDPDGLAVLRRVRMRTHREETWTWEACCASVVCVAVFRVRSSEVEAPVRGNTDMR